MVECISHCTEQVLFILAGIPTIFSSSHLSVPFLLNLMHLPSDAFELYLSSHTIDNHFNAALSSMSISSFTVICVALLSGFSRIRIKKDVYIGPEYSFVHLLVNAYQGGGFVNIIELAAGRIELSELIDGSPLKSQIDAKVYLNASGVPSPRPGEPIEGDVLKRIKQRDVLRAGYDINTISFSFFNNRGELIGYGVEMAYDLARFLNVSRLELIPIGNSLAEPLESDECDIITSFMITPKRLGEIEFTNSYMTTQLAFVVRDYRKKEFLRLEDVQRMPNLRVAVLNGSSLEIIASDLLPNATIINVNSYKDFFQGMLPMPISLRKNMVLS
jgi:ABC-type amino acid transport substrate-binding protein